MQGFEMRIDENGDAEGNYTLLALQKVEPVNNDSHPDYYPLREALTITADFMANPNPMDLPELRFKREMRIRWPTEDGRPPLDEPVCGFDGENCRKESWWTTVLMTIFITTLLVFTIIVFISYRLNYY